MDLLLGVVSIVTVLICGMITLRMDVMDVMDVGRFLAVIKGIVMSTYKRRGLPGHTGTVRLCDRTHAIKEEPESTYFDRYPKAVGVWSIGSCRKHLCAECGRTFERKLGMRRELRPPVLGSPY